MYFNRNQRVNNTHQYSSPKLESHFDDSRLNRDLNNHQAWRKTPWQRLHQWTFEHRVNNWVSDVLISCTITFLVMFIANVIIDYGIGNSWFGPLAAPIGTLWPQIMPALGALIALLTILRHRPYY